MSWIGESHEVANCLYMFFQRDSIYGSLRQPIKTSNKEKLLSSMLEFSHSNESFTQYLCWVNSR